LEPRGLHLGQLIITLLELALRKIRRAIDRFLSRVDLAAMRAGLPARHFRSVDQLVAFNLVRCLFRRLKISLPRNSLLEIFSSILQKEGLFVEKDADFRVVSVAV
jgi:hypothetical protein